MGAIDGNTFYDRNGAIAPGQPYLIGVNRSQGNISAYYLEEVPSINNIYWGEMRDYVLPGLVKLTRKK